MGYRSTSLCLTNDTDRQIHVSTNFVYIYCQQINQFLVIMRSLLIWVGVSGTASCEKSVNKSVIMLEKLRGALQMKMTATCGIQKFRWREKIKHLSKYWGVVNTGRPLQAKYWGVSTHSLTVSTVLRNISWYNRKVTIGQTYRNQKCNSCQWRCHTTSADRRRGTPHHHLFTLSRVNNYAGLIVNV